MVFRESPFYLWTALRARHKAVCVPCRSYFNPYISAKRKAVLLFQFKELGHRALMQVPILTSWVTTGFRAVSVCPYAGFVMWVRVRENLEPLRFSVRN